MARVSALILILAMLGGCGVVDAGASVVGAAVGVAGSAAGAAIDVTGAAATGAVNLATSGSGDDDEKAENREKATEEASASD